MMEILMNNWVEICFGLLIVGFLLIVIFLNITYEEYKKQYEYDEYADLKKKLPKLPKEKKKK